MGSRIDALLADKRYGRVYAGLRRGGIVCLDTSTGEILHRVSIAAPFPEVASMVLNPDKPELAISIAGAQLRRYDIALNHLGTPLKMNLGFHALTPRGRVQQQQLLVCTDWSACGRIHILDRATLKTLATVRHHVWSAVATATSVFVTQRPGWSYGDDQQHFYIEQLSFTPEKPPAS